MMMRSFLFFVLFFLQFNVSISQELIEKEILKIDYSGSADIYDFVLDSVSGTYCYAYRIEDQNKSFIISNNSTSEKYDYVMIETIQFDSKGNYYAITSNYKPDYGVDNYFLIVNGKEVRNSNYIDGYSSYINNNGDYVFIFKDNELYRLGYYNIDKGFIESEAYENIKPIYRYVESFGEHEGDGGPVNPENFYRNEKGERGFIANAFNQTKIIFETSSSSYDCSDIYESSVTTNKNNELSFIGKKNGKFFEHVGNEFVVSGNKEYDEFQLAKVPLLFNSGNEPVYSAGDSIGEYKYDYWLMIGNAKQNVKYTSIKSDDHVNLGYGLSNIKVNDNGNISYVGAQEIMIPATKKTGDEPVYDEFYSRSFFVDNGLAQEMGYNVNKIVYGPDGDMLYSGMADLKQKKSILMLNYGDSRVILSKDKFDDIYDYGYSPSGEIYYVAQNYEVPEKKKPSETYLFIGGKQVGKYEYVVFQYSPEKSSVIRFGPNNEYAYVAEERLDSNTFSDFVVTDKGRLPFPSNSVTDSKSFSYISYLNYSSNGRLFFIGNVSTDPVTYVVTQEVFVDNKSMGKTYTSVSNVRYNAATNQMTFNGARGDKIYFVIVNLN